jgi:hypothetical protein
MLIGVRLAYPAASELTREVSVAFDGSGSIPVHRRLLCTGCRQHFYQQCVVSGDTERFVHCPRCGGSGMYRLPGEPTGPATRRLLGFIDGHAGE